MNIYSIKKYLKDYALPYEVINKPISIEDISATTRYPVDCWFDHVNGSVILTVFINNRTDYYNITDHNSEISINKIASPFGGTVVSIDKYLSNNSSGNKAFVFSICYRKPKLRFVDLNEFKLEIIGKNLSVFSRSGRFIKAYRF